MSHVGFHNTEYKATLLGLLILAEISLYMNYWHAVCALRERLYFSGAVQRANSTRLPLIDSSLSIRQGIR